MKRLLPLLFALSCAPVQAQPSRRPHGLLDPQEVTRLVHPEFLREYAESRGYLLGRPVKPKITDQGRVLFLRSEATSRSQSLYEWRNGQARLLLTPEQLLHGKAEKISAAEKARNERKRQLGTGFTEFFPNPMADQVLLPLSGSLYLYEFASGQAHKLPVKGPVLDPQWAPNGRRIAYVRGYDVFVLDLPSGRETAVTRGGTLPITNGIAEFVAQEEMRRLSGYVWGPDSQTIAFEQADHRPVEIWHISDPLHPENPPQQQYYPRPGKPNVRVRLGIVRVGDPSHVTWVKWGPGIEYLAGMKWHKRGGLTLQLQDRLQHLLRLVQVDPKSGSVRTLIEERHAAWVPLHHELPIWKKDGSGFVYLRQRGDRMAPVFWTPSGTRWLDPAQQYDVEEVVGIHGDQVLLRVDGLEGQPGDPQLRWLSLTGTAAPASPDLDGVTEAVLGKNGGIVVQQQSMEVLPRLVYLPPGGAAQPMEGAGLQPRLRVDAHFETVEAEGREYRTVWFTPEEFDAQHRYPVIVDVYGGPTKVQVAHNRRGWLVDQWLADQGFVVVSIDNRGTPGRGRAWETAVYGHFHDVPLQDQVVALKALGERHPELDLERVGIWGWSFGGYLSAQAVLVRPDFFQAAVAGAPVTDWSDYDTHYTERYLGTPGSNPRAYSRSNLVNLAGTLQRPLLLIHGSADDNVYYRHSLKLSEGLFRAGQKYELLTLPGITHSYRPDVEVTRAVWERVVGFFRRHLGLIEARN